MVGIVADGSLVTHGGLDNDGNAYAAGLLGTSLSWADSTFTLGAAGTYDAVSNTTIALPAGQGSTVNLLATAVNGNRPNQTFIVTYTDGTTASFTQSLSDWYTPQRYGGETKVSEMAYRIRASGATDNRTFYLYGYSFPINSAKTVKSLTLPQNRHVVVLAVDVSETDTVPFMAAAPSLSPAPETYTAAREITLSDSTPGAVIYYTTNGTTPTTSSAKYRAGTPLEIRSTTRIEAIAVASGYHNSAVIGATYTITSATTAPPSAETLKISGTPATTAEIGKFYSFTPTVVASAGSSLTYAVANKPAWAQFSAASGTLSGTPTAGSAATDANIVVSVSNGATSASLPAFNIAVAPAVVTPASLTLSANPSTVASGATSRLTWSSTNATSCTASSGWSGTEPTSGSQTTAALTATTKYSLTCSGAAGSASQSAVVSVASSGTGTGTSTIPNITALPAGLPGPNTSAYDALNVESQAAGYSFNDPVTGVKTWKLTDATHPASGTAFAPVYSEGPLQISLPWGPNKDQYTIMFMNADSSTGYLVDFGLSTSATPGPYNYRAAPVSINGYATVGAATFSRLAPAAHPQLMYVLTSGGYVRLFDANVSVMAYVDSSAAAYGYSSSWPSTGWHWTTALNQWLSTTADEVWIIGNNANSSANEAFALNLQTGVTQTWSIGQDDMYVGYGHYVTGDGQTQVWDLDTNTQVSFSEELTAANGWSGGEATFHGSSTRGSWIFYNTNYGDGVIPVATIGDTSSNAAQVTIGSGATAPYMSEYWGQFHGSGEWWLQTPGANQYFLQSNWSTPSSGWSANAEYAMTFWNVGTGQGYRLGAFLLGL